MAKVNGGKRGQSNKVTFQDAIELGCWACSENVQIWTWLVSMCPAELCETRVFAVALRARDEDGMDRARLVLSAPSD